MDWSTPIAATIGAICDCATKSELPDVSIAECVVGLEDEDDIDDAKSDADRADPQSNTGSMSPENRALKGVESEIVLLKGLSADIWASLEVRDFSFQN